MFPSSQLSRLLSSASAPTHALKSGLRRQFNGNHSTLSRRFFTTAPRSATRPRAPRSLGKGAAAAIGVAAGISLGIANFAFCEANEAEMVVATGDSDACLADTVHNILAQHKALKSNTTGDVVSKEGGSYSTRDDPLKDSQARYAAYTGRLAIITKRTLAAISRLRYLGYTSDIGESLRPVLKPQWVTYFYGITWAYVACDCAYQGMKESDGGGDSTQVLRTVSKTFVFQSIASVAIPSILIHQAVHLAQKGFAKAPPRVRVMGPAIVGLALIPLMPFIDEPAEHLIFAGFDYAWPGQSTIIEDHGH